MKLRGTIVAFLMSQSAWLLLSIVSSFSLIKNPMVMLGVGIVFIPSFAGLFYYLQSPVTSDGSKGIKRNWFYYMCGLNSWSCTIDFILFFEARGTIQGYMDFYLDGGEPYFRSAFGMWINFWDAIVHLALYLIIIYKFDNKQNYRSVGLYWFGSMFAGMFCLIIGSLVGSYGDVIRPALFLNTPYIILPFCALVHLLRMKTGGKRGKTEETTYEAAGHGVLSNILVIGSIFTFAYGIVRGFAALDSPLPFVEHYVAEYEPYISEPGKFGAMHCLFNLIYCVPIQIAAMYAYFNRDMSWGRDLALLLSGATAQGTFYYVMAAYSPDTPEEYRIKGNAEYALAFNLVPVLISHLLLFCWKSKESKVGKQH